MRNVLPKSGNRNRVIISGRRFAGWLFIAIVFTGLAAGAVTGCRRDFLTSMLTGGTIVMMKVVVWKSPKCLRGLLCRIFHI